MARRNSANHTNDALGNNKSLTLPHRLKLTAEDNRISRVRVVWEYRGRGNSRRRVKVIKMYGITTVALALDVPRPTPTQLEDGISIASIFKKKLCSFKDNVNMVNVTVEPKMRYPNRLHTEETEYTVYHQLFTEGDIRTLVCRA